MRTAWTAEEPSPGEKLRPARPPVGPDGVEPGRAPRQRREGGRGQQCNPCVGTMRPNIVESVERLDEIAERAELDDQNGVLLTRRRHRIPRRTCPPAAFSRKRKKGSRPVRCALDPSEA